jgi:hypothetical protein
VGAINWIPKQFHGDSTTSEKLIDEFPKILTAGLQRAPLWSPSHGRLVSGRPKPRWHRYSALCQPAFGEDSTGRP